MLRRHSLTEQARQLLRERIRNAEFADGRIPSELELAEQLGVSRTTVRGALTQLESEGVIVRRQGAGTFVNDQALQLSLRLEEIWSYEGMLRAHGFTPATRILRVEEAGVSADITTTLDLPADTPFLIVHKLFLENDQPVILTINRIPIPLIAAPWSAEDFLPPIFDFLDSVCQVQLAWYLSDIVPLAASGLVAEALHLLPGTPLIAFEEVGYDGENRPTIHAHSFFRDDLLRLRLMRRRPSLPSL
jgi:GntR family transcriptional regulator